MVELRGRIFQEPVNNNKKYVKCDDCKGEFNKCFEFISFKCAVCRKKLI